MLVSVNKFANTLLIQITVFQITLVGQFISKTKLFWKDISQNSFTCLFNEKSKNMVIKLSAFRHGCSEVVFQIIYVAKRFL